MHFKRSSAEWHACCPGPNVFILSTAAPNITPGPAPVVDEPVGRESPKMDPSIISGLVAKEEDSVHLSLVAEAESVAHAVASGSSIPTVAKKESNNSLSASDKGTLTIWQKWYLAVCFLQWNQQRRPRALVLFTISCYILPRYIESLQYFTSFTTSCFLHMYTDQMSS